MTKEKIDEIEKKIAQLKAQKQALIAREKEKERKERTRRLIQIGATIESRLNLNLQETELLCNYLYNNPSILKDINTYVKTNLEPNLLENQLSSKK